MNAIRLPLMLILASLGTSFSQQPQPVQPRQLVPQPMSRGALRPPGVPAGQEEAVDLIGNYRLTFTLKTGDKAGKDFSVLTASSQIRLNTVMDADNPALGAISVEVSGTLTEKDEGRLRLSYNISAGVPIMTQGGNQIVSDSVTGVLAVEPGKSYEVFKNSTRSYTVTVSPEFGGSAK